MASLNKIILIGNVGGEPNIRDYQGIKVASFSLATNEKYKKSNGEVAERVEWFRITFWGGTNADLIEKYVKKGTQIYVEGRLSTGEYTDKEGKTRTSLEVRGGAITLLGTAPTSTQPSNETTNSNNSDVPKTNSTEDTSNSQAADDLPF